MPPHTSMIKYGISEIDTNHDLKMFIVQQNERRLNVKNKLHHDIRHFIEDLAKINEGSAKQ